MILGDNRPAVIENIKKNVQAHKLNAKGELDDPNLSREEVEDALERFLALRTSKMAEYKRKEARGLVAAATKLSNTNTEIIGLEKLEQIQDGAIVVCNHFNQLDYTVVRHTLRQKDHKRINIVIEATNLALGGVFGLIMNHADTIPISDNFDYMRGEFIQMLEQAAANKEYIVIYPEQEMWFNYRKPRPGKRGAYYYASQLGLPVISLFVEIRDLPTMDDDHFHHVQYIVHVLDPLYPDPAKSNRQNSIDLLVKDDAQRKEAYEKAYGKDLIYDFSYDDIAGYDPATVPELETATGIQKSQTV